MHNEIIERLRDLHKQATVERSHYYVGKCVMDAIAEIKRLHELLTTQEVIYRDILEECRALRRYHPNPPTSPPRSTSRRPRSPNPPPSR